MLYQKLVRVLKTFDHVRLARLGKYVRSPYFAVNPKAIELFEYLAPLHPAFDEKQLTEPRIRRELKFKTPKIQETAGVRLMRAIEKFIALEKWKEKKAMVKQCELEAWKDYGLGEEFEKSFAGSMERAERHLGADLDSFAERHTLTELHANGFDARVQQRGRRSIMPVVTTLDEYYAMKKLRYLCEALNRQQHYGQPVVYHEQHVPTLLGILKPYTNAQHPYVYLFVNVFEMLMAQSFAESEISYRLIQQFAARHPVAEPLSVALRESIPYAYGHCLRWANAGHKDAGTEYLWWVEYRLKRGLLLERGQLQPIFYRNIVSMAVECSKDKKWLSEVVENYARYVPRAQRTSCLEFGRALLAYAQRKHKVAIRHLLSVETGDDLVWSCVIRRWQFMCLYAYDREHIDALSDHLLAFEKFLLRHKDALKTVTPVFNTFIAYSHKLVNANHPDEWCSAYSDLQEVKHFPGRQWLLEAYAAKSKRLMGRRRQLDNVTM